MQSPVLEPLGSSDPKRDSPFPFLQLPTPGRATPVKETPLHTFPLPPSSAPQSASSQPPKKKKSTLREQCTCDVVRGLRTSSKVLLRSAVGLLCSPFEFVYHAVRVAGCPVEFCYYTACGEYRDESGGDGTESKNKTEGGPGR